ncbi:MAG: hypothetical protein ACREO5_00870 [Candidatus Binatia bacterium]
MSGKLRKFLVHGSFEKKKDAVAKEREVGGFIRPATIKGERRFLVLTTKK